MGTTNKIKAYSFHGVIINDEDTSDTVCGECPFCNKPNHFYVNKEGQFKCHSCQEHGNLITFLQKLLTASVAKTTKKDYKALSKSRNVPTLILQQWGLCKSVFTDDWLIPVYNYEDKLSNVTKFVEKNNKFRPYNTPSCKQHLFGTQFADKNHKKIWVCEGPWDAMALASVLSKLTTKDDKRLTETNLVVGVPGAGTWNKAWFSYCDQKELILVFDNDHPRQTRGGGRIQAGWDGMNRIASMAESSDVFPASLRILHWGKDGYDSELPDKYDIRDLITDNTSPSKIYNYLTERLVIRKIDTAQEESVETLVPIERTTFKDLCKDYATNLHFTKSMEQTLAVMLATVISTDLEGDQLWFRIIGPPGSGKTTLAESLTAAKQYVMSRSVITGFHSGYIGDTKGRAKGDPSLIPAMRHKTFIVKDADTLLSSPKLPEILAQLRDIYDGTSRSQYRNREVKLYDNIKVTFLLCGTDHLRIMNRSSLGERFLDIEIIAKNEDTVPYLDKSLSNTYARIINSNLTNGETVESEQTILKRCTMGFVHHLKDNLENYLKELPFLDDSSQETIKNLAQLLSLLRARVIKEKEEILYRPRPELATRLVAQLAKLSICLCFVLDKKEIDKEVIEIVKKVVWDTAEGYQAEIVKTLYKHKSGMTIESISSDLGLARTTTLRVLKDLAEYKIINRGAIPNNTGNRGRYSHLWTLSKKTRKLVKRSK